jgi:hypothetical protein
VKHIYKITRPFIRELRGVLLKYDVFSASVYLFTSYTCENVTELRYNMYDSVDMFQCSHHACHLSSYTHVKYHVFSLSKFVRPLQSLMMRHSALAYRSVSLLAGCLSKDQTRKSVMGRGEDCKVCAFSLDTGEAKRRVVWRFDTRK